MLAGCQSLCADDSMSMVGSTADNRVGLIQQLSIHLLVVIIYLHVGEESLVLIQNTLSILEVNIAHANELDIIINLVLTLVSNAVDIGMSASTYTYT